MMYDEAFLARLLAGLAGVLPQWGLGPDTSLRLLTISENATYLAEAPDGEKYIFRVHRPDYHSAAEIEAELAWIAALGEEGVVTTPVPLPTLDGRHLVSFADGRFVVAFSFVAGREPDAESDLTRWYGHLGEITARLHDHARGWARPEGFVRKIWNFDTIIGRDAYWGIGGWHRGWMRRGARRWSAPPSCCSARLPNMGRMRTGSGWCIAICAPPTCWWRASAWR